jgi:putative transposase
MIDSLDRPGHRALRCGRCSLPGAIYHITTATCERTPLFRDFQRACAAAASIASRESLGDSRLLAWVLMPDHVHLLLQLGTHGNLSSLVGGIKARSGKATQRAAARRFRVWAKGYHDRALRREDELQTVARYIIANPVRAGLVQRCGDYPFWDAMWLP